jgi:hypothetical protein
MRDEINKVKKKTYPKTDASSSSDNGKSSKPHMTGDTSTEKSSQV